MRLASPALTTLALLVCSAAARADDIVNYTLSGVTFSGTVEADIFTPSFHVESGTVSGTVTGTFSIDYTQGTYLDGDLSVNVNPNAYGVTGFTASNEMYSLPPAATGYNTPANFFQPGYGVVSDNAVNLVLTFSAPLGTTPSLILGPVSSSQVDFAPIADDAFSGQPVFTAGTLIVTPAPSATPEPSSLALLGTGILGVAGAARHRFKR